MHRCGRCQAEFTALEEFVQHKLQKSCQRVPQESTGSILPDGQQVTPMCTEEPLWREASISTLSGKPWKPNGGHPIGCFPVAWVKGPDTALENPTVGGTGCLF